MDEWNQLFLDILAEYLPGGYARATELVNEFPDEDEIEFINLAQKRVAKLYREVNGEGS